MATWFMHLLTHDGISLVLTSTITFLWIFRYIRLLHSRLPRLPASLTRSYLTSRSSRLRKKSVLHRRVLRRLVEASCRQCAFQSDLHALDTCVDCQPLHMHPLHAQSPQTPSENPFYRSTTEAELRQRRIRSVEVKVKPIFLGTVCGRIRSSQSLFRWVSVRRGDIH